jgi:flagellar biosynthetic protein FliQ
MSPESVMQLGTEALYLTLKVSAPMLLSALIIGLIISIFQAATQINESTLSFIPKLVGVFLALVLTGAWMLAELTDFTRNLFLSIPQWVSS